MLAPSTTLITLTTFVNRLSTRSSQFSSQFIAIGLLGIVFSLSACGRKIGDDCETAIDCGDDASRVCDLSQPGGYCTTDGCDWNSCPEEAACIRYFPRKFLSLACDPSLTQSEGNGCKTDELCLPSGLCAPRSTERRYCALECERDKDCRDGYECRLAGQFGSLALTNASRTVRFCAPRTPLD